MSSATLAILIKATDAASSVLQGISGNVGKMESKWKVAGAAVGAAGATIAGALSTAAREAASFDTGMREVNTLINLSESDFKALSTETRNLSAALGVDAVDSTKALYQAISAGVPKENAMQFLEVASKAAIGGVTDTETAVDGLTTVLNAFGMDMSQAQEAADVMFATVRQGKTDFSQLSGALYNVAPIAATAGVKFDEVSAAIATLTKSGVPTAQATTQIRAAIQAVIKPTQEMAGALKGVADQLIESGEITGKEAEQYKAIKADIAAAGKEYQTMGTRLDELKAAGKEGTAEFKNLQAAMKENDAEQKEMNKQLTELATAFGPAIIESKGLQGTLDLLNKSADGNMNTLGKMYGSVEGLSAVLGITGDNAQVFATDLDAMRNSAGNSTTAFEEMNKSSERWGDQIKAQMQNATIAVGDFLGPSQGLIAMLPGMSAGFSLVGGGIGHLLPLLGGLKMALLAQVIPAVGATIVALGPILLPIAAIGAAVALLALAWTNNWGDIQGKTQGAMEFLGKAFSDGQQTIAAIWHGISLSVQGAINTIIGAINGLLTAWNALEITLPKIDIPDWVPIIGGQTWGGNSIGTPDVGLLPYVHLVKGGSSSTTYKGAFATGGVVPGPFGSPGWAIVHGGERILRPEQAASTVIQVTVQGSVIAERDLAATIQAELQKYGRRNVAVGLV